MQQELCVWSHVFAPNSRLADEAKEFAEVVGRCGAAHSHRRFHEGMGPHALLADELVEEELFVDAQVLEKVIQQSIREELALCVQIGFWQIRMQLLQLRLALVELTQVAALQRPSRVQLVHSRGEGTAHVLHSQVLPDRTHLVFHVLPFALLVCPNLLQFGQPLPQHWLGPNQRGVRRSCESQIPLLQRHASADDGVLLGLLKHVVFVHSELVLHIHRLGRDLRRRRSGHKQVLLVLQGSLVALRHLLRV